MDVFTGKSSLFFEVWKTICKLKTSFNLTAPKGCLLTVLVINEVHMVTNADKEVALWTAERYTVRSSIELNQSDKDVILVPDPYRVICATGSDQFHLRTARQTRDCVHVVILWAMITAICGETEEIVNNK